MNKLIILIAPGYMPLPAPGWGAVERIVWDYYENLKKRNYNIQIVNTSNPNQIIQECNKLNPDIVHIMYDDHIVVAPYLTSKNIYYTSHYAYITHPKFQQNYSYYFNNIFQKVIQLKEKIKLNVISDDIKKIYVKYGFPAEKINVIRNGAREDNYLYKTTPLKSNKSIYLGKVELRKGQYKYQSISNIDFVGNYHDSSFDKTNANYLGEWTKDKLYEQLTEYGNLVLLSEGEADPLVVKEALLAGLGVVISECSAANLDLTKQFITIIPNLHLNDLIYVKNTIEQNRLVSIKCRDEIRKYAINNFSWKKIIDEYCKICLEF
jgi:glycosyltransferase involved in cell wall biosynthesis